MNKFTRKTVLVIGIYACILGAVHGFFEISHGFSPTDGVLISAVPVNTAVVDIWHANLPAISVIPNYLITGLITILLSGYLIYYMAFALKSKRDSYKLLIISILYVLIGAGFIPFFLLGICIISTLFLTSLKQKELPRKLKSWGRPLWTIGLTIYIVMVIAEWIIGLFNNHMMFQLKYVWFIAKTGLPILLILLAYQNDSQLIEESK